MQMNSEISVFESDLFVVTGSGAEELKGGLTRLPSVALELLVVLDGRTSIAAAAERGKGRSVEELRRAAQMLLKGGYIEAAGLAQEMNLDFSYFFNDSPGADPVQARTEEHQPEADRGSAALKIDGYYVSIARKAAAPIPPVNGSVYSILIVEDVPELQDNLRRLLRLEGFLTRQAGNRDEILAQLRTPAAARCGSARCASSRC